MGFSTDESSTPPVEKDAGPQVELVKANEQVPGHSNYYEKGGLRTYGDDEDHDHEPPVCHKLTRCHTKGC